MVPCSRTFRNFPYSQDVRVHPGIHLGNPLKYYGKTTSSRNPGCLSIVLAYVVSQRLSVPFLRRVVLGLVGWASVNVGQHIVV